MDEDQEVDWREACSIAAVFLVIGAVLLFFLMGVAWLLLGVFL